jgi:ATP-binding cassette subfamily B multidrug efflux pump
MSRPGKAEGRAPAPRAAEAGGDGPSGPGPRESASPEGAQRGAAERSGVGPGRPGPGPRESASPEGAQRGAAERSGVGPGRPGPGPRESASPEGAPGARRIRDDFWRYRGAFALGLLCLVLTQATALSVPPLLRRATDALIGGAFADARGAALMLFGVALVGALFRILSRVLIFNSGRRVEYDVRRDLFAQLTRLPPSFYGGASVAAKDGAAAVAGMSSGQILSRAVNDLTQVRLLLGPGLLNLTNATLVYAVVIPLLFLSDPTLAALSLVTVPLLLFSGRWMGQRIYHLSREAQDRLGELSGKVQENLGGLTTIRVYAREDAEIARFGRLNDGYYESNVRLARLRGFLFPLMGLFGAVGSVVVLWLGGQRMIRGEMSVGAFVEFNAYLATLTWPTIALGWMISLWQRGLAAMDRINEIFAVEPSLVDGDGVLPTPVAGRLGVRGLDFRYPGASRDALVDVRLDIEPGSLVVVVGRTGSGKTTLLRSLARLLEIPAGRVELDGQDVTRLPLAAVRGTIAYAPQDAFLFSRSIFDNVAFGRPDADEATVREAVRAAGLDVDLDGFPEGLDTIVGERGITLSGGQRQRAALARALAMDTPVLLLDDTLSAVDTETETRILAELRGGRRRTTVLVTHRLACAAHADRVVVLDEGRVVEQGTETELIARGGLYAEMHRRQRRREAIEAAVPVEGAA